MGFDTAVLSYEPTWHAVRIGVESKVWIDDRWSVSGEIAVVPYAALQNKDSHLLRQSLPISDRRPTSSPRAGMPTASRPSCSSTTP